MADKDEGLVQAKTSKTLIIRHLPADLTREEKEDLLKYFGAVSVRVLSDKGVLVGQGFSRPFFFSHLIYGNKKTQ